MGARAGPGGSAPLQQRRQSCGEQSCSSPRLAAGRRRFSPPLACLSQVGNPPVFTRTAAALPGSRSEPPASPPLPWGPPPCHHPCAGSAGDPRHVPPPRRELAEEGGGLISRCPTRSPAQHRAQHRSSAGGGSDAFSLCLSLPKPFVQQNSKLSDAASAARRAGALPHRGFALLREGIPSALNLEEFQPYFSTPDC